MRAWLNRQHQRQVEDLAAMSPRERKWFYFIVAAVWFLAANVVTLLALGTVLSPLLVVMSMFGSFLAGATWQLGLEAHYQAKAALEGEEA